MSPKCLESVSYIEKVNFRDRNMERYFHYNVLCFGGEENCTKKILLFSLAIHCSLALSVLGVRYPEGNTQYWKVGGRKLRLG